MKKIFRIFSVFAMIFFVFLSYSNFTNTNPMHKYKYLALGDSYTIGESVEENDRFPVQLSNKLRGDDIDISDPLIIAKTGWTTDELMNAINEKNVKDTFDVVTLLIGVNNQYRGKSAEEYRKEFKELLNKAISFAGGNSNHVFVLSIPDWGVTPFAEGRDKEKIAKEIDIFNAINKEETIKSGAGYFDITDISRLAKDDKSLVATDGLHPSGKMYTAWVKRIYNGVKSSF